MNAVARCSSAGSLAVRPSLQNLKISFPFEDSSEVVLFNLYIFPLGNGSRSVKEAGDNGLFHMAWVVRGKVQVLVCVGGLSVDACVKGSFILAMEECVWEW